ncbi:hypothetical protein Tco_1432303 [Tanacetum coccineum]
MKTKRDSVKEEEEKAPGSMKKKQKTLSEEEEVKLGFDNALLPLANYDDDHEEDNDIKLDGNGKHQQQHDEEEDEDMKVANRRKAIEIRRDCPYLDTVNRQSSDYVVMPVFGLVDIVSVKRSYLNDMD